MMIPIMLLSGVRKKTLIMTGVRIIMLQSVRIIILYLQDGELSHLEQNSHILLIIILVFSVLVILLALLRHCWRKRVMTGARQRQIQIRTGGAGGGGVRDEKLDTLAMGIGESIVI